MPSSVLFPLSLLFLQTYQFKLLLDPVLLLLGQQSPFAFETPAIARQITVFADHPVARYDQGYRVGGTGTGYRPDCPRLTQATRNFAIRARAAVRNFP